MVGIGGADQREVLLVGDCEEDPPVGQLEEVGEGVVVKFFHDDVAAAHQPHPALRAFARPVEQVEHRGAGGIDHRAGGELACGGVDLPMLAYPCQPLGRAMGADGGPAQRGIARVQHHQPGIIDPAIRIDECMVEAGLQRAAGRVAAKPDALRGGQPLAPADVIVEKQAKPQQPARAQALHVRQHEAQRPDDVRGDGPQPLALGQRFTDQRKFVMFKIAQAAVDQLGRGR